MSAAWWKERRAHFSKGSAMESSLETVGPMRIERRVMPTKDFMAFVSWLKPDGVSDFTALWDAWRPHVTVIYSSQAPDEQWPKADEDYIPLDCSEATWATMRGETLALTVSNESLLLRHTQLRGLGYSWDFPHYTPHITFPRKLFGLVYGVEHEPFRGTLVLGPEIFHRLRPGKVRKPRTEVF